MTERVREALRDMANSVEPSSLYDGAIARARRRKRRGLVGATAVVIALLGVAVPVSRSAVTPAAPLGIGPSLPDRVGAPHWGTSSVTSSPVGAASVVFGAPAWWISGSKGVLAVVGANRDDYRLTDQLDDYHHAGEQAVLSPDGTRLATVGRVTDLGTGTSVPLPALDAELVVPQAWSPDGTTLAVIAYDTRIAREPDGSEVFAPTRATLHLVDLASATDRRIADLDPSAVHDGYLVAFAPGGDRLAYQSARTVTVASSDGTTVSTFTLGDGDHLAGKGSWTPDGQGLTLLRQRRCCDGDAYPSRWQLTVVDPTTGEPLPAPALPELPGLVGVRLLGWSPSGEAVVAALYPEPGSPIVGFDTSAHTLSLAQVQFTDYQRVRAVSVLAVGSGTRTLLTAPDQQMLSVDVADDLIAGGQRRSGQPPEGLSPRLTAVLVAVALAVAAILVVVVLAIRRSRMAQRTR
ncbi:hypothetical protein Ais01nite_13630 [Asanoa ishikariensis]|uniref:WD40-like Beta Propeller Repeat n=1 Tax=Asanoa ishikariensis TaxID=137265 RepID=A0A1H3UZQ2_9ACTN|nr:hypothetical protein [Asanoa ishikariensis]GIF63328.1 hypothetical protein Ais01nite_13630 [Asanoa ishikariensis]SDZ67786.1 hypothetical protein SAMN05421684_8518 [Asanoa ishikariensis]